MELLGKSEEELREFCAALGEPAYRGGQIYHALYAERKFDFTQMTNLPSALRERLAKEAKITLPVVKQRFVSADESVRYLFALANTVPRKKRFERREHRKEKRRSDYAARFGGSGVHAERGAATICISTQAGCAVDCQFCLTAQLGLIRNLTAEDCGTSVAAA